MDEPLALIVIISALGPIIGSAIGVLRRPSFTYVCYMLSFAAGVMIAISMLELVPESVRLSSVGVCTLGFISGALVMYALDRVIPHVHPELCTPEQGRNLKRTSTYLIFGIFLHNFPEGMAIAAGGVSEIKFSLAIALAIAIHNIPEGICTAAPHFHTTGKRLRAFLVSSSTALPILGGFIIARYLFQSISHEIIGLIIGATAGLMIYITADELIPTSCAGRNHGTVFSLIAGVVFVIFLEAL